MLKSLLWKTEKTADVVASENKSVLADDLKLTKLLSIMSKEPNIRMTKEIFLSALAHEEINILYIQYQGEEKSDRTGRLTIESDSIR